MRHILAIDEGTTGVRAAVVNEAGDVVSIAYRELTLHYPQPGWVETDAEAVWRDTQVVCRQALAEAQLEAGDVTAIGIANQRSSVVVWHRETGQPICPAITWQDTRTAARVPEILEQGIYTNSMASATKLEWILQTVPDARAAAEAGQLCFGTIDSWLVWKLTAGNVHVTDYSNASCTGLYDPIMNEWDANALQVLNIPATMLPRIADSSTVYGTTTADAFGAEVPIAGLAGDQQAAMFGELGVETGAIKVTYGTSGMVDVNVGDFPIISMRGAFPLILWGLNGQRTYCLEGSVITAGAAVQWLRDQLGIIPTLAESATCAESVADAGGVWAVPAFQGLGTPHMETSAHAVIGGLSRASTRAHIVRAVLESIAYRTREVVSTILEDASITMPPRLRVDGGAAENDFLLQQLANTLGVAVERPHSVQASSLGVAYLAGLATGIWSDIDTLKGHWRAGKVFEPQWDTDQRDTRFTRWQQAVAAARIQAGGEE